MVITRPPYSTPRSCRGAISASIWPHVLRFPTRPARDHRPTRLAAFAADLQPDLALAIPEALPPVAPPNSVHLIIQVDFQVAFPWKLNSAFSLCRVSQPDRAPQLSLVNLNVHILFGNSNF